MKKYAIVNTGIVPSIIRRFKERGEVHYVYQVGIFAGRETIHEPDDSWHWLDIGDEVLWEPEKCKYVVERDCLRRVPLTDDEIARMQTEAIEL